MADVNANFPSNLRIENDGWTRGFTKTKYIDYIAPFVFLRFILFAAISLCRLAFIHLLIHLFRFHISLFAGRAEEKVN